MKTRTIICDIDGCIFVHFNDGPIRQWSDTPELLPGVHDAFRQWESESACIVLMTARRESCRQQLELWLQHRGLFWDHLIMGVGHGQRVLINDSKPNASVPSAVAFTITRNEGLLTCTRNSESS